MNTHVVILAAGKGSRMRSNSPKVLAKLANKPLLAYVIDAAYNLGAHKIHVVVGHEAEQVKGAFPNPDLHWCNQEQQLGTGDAVKIALPNIPDEDRVLILYGDVPLIKTHYLQSLIDNLGNHELSILTATLEDATGYGRIIRDPNLRVNGIVEHKDANKEQLSINEINTGILAANAKHLKQWLEKLQPNNAQGEYYLTDIVSFAYNDECSIFTDQPENVLEIEGINSRVELAQKERQLQSSIAQKYLKNGLSIVDPLRLDVRGKLDFGADCSVDINTIINGNVELGNNVIIHANCILTDCKIKDNTVVHPNSVLEGCNVGANVNIGPFARVRPGTNITDSVKIGNFVEIKNSLLHSGSKVNHLSYIGDSEVGKNSNIGAGTITCNYDGVNKHKTKIGDNAFIGSNSQLIAPVEIANNATIAAGSTIINSVPEGNLAVARSRQKNLKGWKRPIKSR